MRQTDGKWKYGPYKLSRLASRLVTDGSLERPDKSRKAEVASRSSGILPFGFSPLSLSLSLFLPFLSCAISIHTFLLLIGLEALQRDLNKIISLLLSPQYNRQNPSEKRQTKWVRKCVGNEVRPLKQGLNQLYHYERLLEYSFITADCWLFWLGHQRCQGKRLSRAVGGVAGHQGARFKCLNAVSRSLPPRHVEQRWKIEARSLERFTTPRL